MKTARTATAALAALTLFGLADAPPARAAGVGAAAPLFEAESSSGPVRLADYRGARNVLLAFYFKDFTAG